MTARFVVQSATSVTMTRKLFDACQGHAAFEFTEILIKDDSGGVNVVELYHEPGLTINIGKMSSDAFSHHPFPEDEEVLEPTS